jgi:uncharacterized protein (TIGR03437 family)
MQNGITNMQISSRAGRWAAAGIATLLLAGQLAGQAPPKYSIWTVAGNGAGGFAGDGGAATSAQVYCPIGLAVDSSGNLYLADQLNHRIRKVTPAGTISTIAGKDLQGFTGNDAAATDATLRNPSGVAVDSAGNVYIADSTNHQVRKVGTDGKITAFAGAGVAGFAELDSESKPLDAKNAFLNFPTGVAVDASNNVYIADTLNHRIRKVGTDGKISTVAGTGEAAYAGDGGTAVAAKINHPTGIAVGPGGSLYIADRLNHRVRKVTSDGIIRTLAGVGVAGYSGNGGPATSANLFYPAGVAADNLGNVFITDSTNNRIRRVSEDGSIYVVAGTGKFGDSNDDAPALSAWLKFPTGIVVASAGRVFFSDGQNSKVKELRVMAEPPTATGPPVIAEGGVRTAAAFGAAGAIAPGAWIEIRGESLAAASREWTPGDFDGPRAPTTLDGTRVSIGGQPAVLAAISPERLGAQAPFSLSAGETQVVVSNAAGESAPYAIQVKAAEPGLEALAAFQVSGVQFAAAQVADSSAYALPAGSVEGIETRPARAGETLVLQGTGFGVVSPHVEAGETTRESNQTVLPVRFLLGETPAEVKYAGLAPGKVGVYEFRVVVPALSEGGTLPLKVSVDGMDSGQNLFVAVEK